MEGFLKILQIGSSTGEYNTGEKFVLVAGKLQLVPYVGKNFFCTCSDNIVQQGQFKGTAVFRRAYGRGLGVFFLLVEGITVLQFQLLGIFLFHLQGSDVVGNVVSTQRQYAEVSQDIVLIDQHGGGVGTEVHQCAARTHLVFGQHGFGQRSGSHEQVVGNFHFGLLETVFEVLLQRGTRHDVEELPGDVSSGNSYGLHMQRVVYLVFLRGYIQHTHVYQGYITVLVANLVYQFLRNDALFLQRTAYRIPHRAQ